MRLQEGAEHKYQMCRARIVNCNKLSSCTGHLLLARTRRVCMQPPDGAEHALIVDSNTLNCFARLMVHHLPHPHEPFIAHTHGCRFCVHIVRARCVLRVDILQVHRARTWFVGVRKCTVNRPL